MNSPTGYTSQHFMVLPAPKFWNSPAASNFSISFSGIAELTLQGKQNGDWNRDSFLLDINAIRIDRILERVRNLLPALPAGANTYAFVPLQWTVYASVNSQLDKESSVNAGFAAENFAVIRTSYPTAQNSAQNVSVLAGMSVDLAVRDKDAFIYKAGYSLNAYGYFSPVYIVPIQ